MFKTEDFHKNVFIDGNVLFDTEKEVSYLDIVAYSNVSKDQFDVVIIPDKSLVENGKTIHYVNNDIICRDDTIYHVSGGVSSYEKEIVRISPYRPIFSYNYNIYGLGELLNSNKDIDQMGTKEISINIPYRDFRLSDTLHRMIYFYALSNLEFFLMEILIVCYLRFSDIKEMYHKRVRFNGLTKGEVIKKLKGYQYNNFEEVENLFITLLRVRIPDFSYLKEAYEKRNDIAHRYKFSKDGEIVQISENELVDHVQYTNEFVYELFNRVLNAVY